MTCPHCGAPSAANVQRGPWFAYIDPPQVFFAGKRLIMPAQQAKMLTHLIRFGRSSTGMLEMMSDGLDRHSVSVPISQIRKALPPGWSIKNIWGWGYELVGDAPLR